MRRTSAVMEAVVVGGGLAGGAAAALLAQGGARVRLMERAAEPRHKVCGEFLSVEAQAHLRALGLDLERLGGAPIARVRLAQGARRIEADLPFIALGLTRKRLDEALLEHAATAGVRLERGVAVRALERGELQTSAGPCHADLTLLATGKHDLRGAQRDRAAMSDYVGFKMYFRLGPAARQALVGFIEVALFEGGYAGLQQVEGDLANLCLVVTGERFARVGKSWDALFRDLLQEPLLRERLSDAEPLLPQPLTIAGIPYGFLYRPSPGDDPRLFRLGDQAAVIPSFSGDGMAIALHSGRLAAAAVLRGESSRTYQARLRRDVGGAVRLATLLQRGGERPWARGAMLAGLSAYPPLLTFLAERTRVPSQALMAAGVVG